MKLAEKIFMHNELDPDIPLPGNGRIQPSKLNPGKVIYSKKLTPDPSRSRDAAPAGYGSLQDDPVLQEVKGTYQYIPGCYMPDPQTAERTALPAIHPR